MNKNSTFLNNSVMIGVVVGGLLFNHTSYAMRLKAPAKALQVNQEYKLPEHGSLSNLKMNKTSKHYYNIFYCAYWSQNGNDFGLALSRGSLKEYQEAMTAYIKQENEESQKTKEVLPRQPQLILSFLKNSTKEALSNNVQKTKKNFAAVAVVDQSPKDLPIVNAGSSRKDNGCDLVDVYGVELPIEFSAAVRMEQSDSSEVEVNLFSPRPKRFIRG